VRGGVFFWVWLLGNDREITKEARPKRNSITKERMKEKTIKNLQLHRKKKGVIDGRRRGSQGKWEGLLSRVVKALK